MKMKDKKDSVFSLISHHRELPLVLILVLLLIVVSALVPGYLKASYMNILKGGSIDLVMACGMLCVLLIGSIDISVAGVLAFSGALAGMLMRDGTIHSVFGMLVVGIGVGAVFGAVSGVLTAYGRVLPIIVTLGMSYVARALIPMEWLLGLNKIAPTDLTESFRGFFLDRSFLGLPYLVWTAILVAVITWLFLRFTRTGRKLYAVGSNEAAAQVRGVNIRAVKVLAHTICGAAAGLAGILWLGYYNAIEKVSATGEEMYVIAACVLGGVSVTGGYGKMSGVVIGALMIATINSAIPQVFIANTMITELFKGILILLAILLNVVLQRVSRKQDIGRRRLG